ncbi:glycosyltransferase family 4 protein [Haloplasma contractile]|uniref:UDP-glucoseLPS alpha-13-glucosyltransferase protein n=1 Tax=Haloplasma contractile SSD-17B TaxID=1033810 RepID=U2FD55_9MOLU|nr:glycosyltransferase [Haloplasma contractile]ERJ10935.1 UDP-glucoseLPS alpha-13-glucosyltransferase protein [Haloplasma contractile SSD-17B]
MNILWIINLPLPEASNLMNKEVIPFGGWLVNASDFLSKSNNVNLTIAFPHKDVSGYKVIEGKRITYYAFSANTNNRKISDTKKLLSILNHAKPDIVHIQGTEYPHSLAFLQLCKERKLKHVISIQGLTSIIAKHYLSNLPLSAIKKITTRDFIKQDNILQQQEKFRQRGLFEIEALSIADNIIGRTTWDKACTTQVNPYASYYKCNETLRNEFYKNEWSLKECEKYSIFISQAYYPIKGLHNMLDALFILKKKYPSVKLYVAGHNFLKSDTIRDKLRHTSYAKYIIKLVHKHDLENHVCFTGVLNEKEMCERFLNSHTFINPSTIENESNSVSEAKLLGVPTIASYVGGVTDRIKSGYDGYLYQHDAPYMLAFYVDKIFSNDKLALELSENARLSALKIHNRKENTEQLLNIYNNIFEKKVKK